MINEKRVLKEKNFFIPKIKTFYFITIVFQIARTLPHSIIVIFLLEKFGLDASFSLFFQISFFIPIFLFEIFSGYLSDILSRKYVYIFSIIFIIIGFSIIGFSNILSLVFFGYFLYGLSTALISGTIEVNFLNYIKDKFQNNKDNLTSAITIFSSNLRIINLVGMAIGGTIGSFIFVYLQNYLFLFSICFFVISLVVTLIFIPNSLQKNIMKANKINIKIYTKDFMTSLKQESVKVTKKNFVLILLFAALLFFLLPYYSTWPILYKNNGLDIFYFGLIYLLFQVIGILTSLIFKKIRFNKIAIFALFISNIFLIILLNFTSGFPLLLLFPISILFFDFYSLSLENKLNKNISRNNSSIQFSIISTILNFFSSVILIITSITFNYVFEPKLILLYSSIISLSLTFIIFSFLIFKKIKKRNLKMLDFFVIK